MVYMRSKLDQFAHVIWHRYSASSLKPMNSFSRGQGTIDPSPAALRSSNRAPIITDVLLLRTGVDDDVRREGAAAVPMKSSEAL